MAMIRTVRPAQRSLGESASKERGRRRLRLAALLPALPLVGFGLLYNLWICVPGTLMVLGSIYAWVFEPPDDPDGPFGEGHGHGEDSAEEPPGEREVASVE